MKTLLLLAVLALSLACADEVAATREAARTAAGAALAEGDPDAALVKARRALKDHGDDAGLLLVAAQASLELERLREACELSERGLALAPGDATLKADLAWVSGKARAARFRELGVLEDWRQANLALRDATRAGSHRDEAALLYVLLQDMGSAGSVERQLEVARELIARAPDSEQASKAKAYLASQGRQP